ncbi:MAG TPA: hypothetical protein VFR97_03675 [Capillimicrobium sp.]|nr:hypothetical protein [Capillimicrobium sp.]
MRFPIAAALAALLLAVLVIAAPAGAAVAPGPYEGDTDQNRAVSFTVKGGKVRAFQAGVMTFCQAGTDSGFETDAVANVPPMKIRANGTFR